MAAIESALAKNQNSTGQNSLGAIAKASGSKADASLTKVGASTINDNFNMFLGLLTTQLKNQNPLEPMSAEKFTEQLVQYSGIEQQIKTNTLLTDMIGQLSANSMMSVLGFMNMQVTAQGASTELKNGQASWTLQSPSTSVVDAKITIRNAANEIVAAKDYTLNPGSQAYLWNGRDKNGIAVPDGNYTISVEAKDATGSIIQVGTQTKGTVNGIDFSGASPILLVGDKHLRIGDITSISSPNSP